MSVHSSLYTSSCTAHIDLVALQHNYKYLRSCIPASAQGMAIIKNDAYGHGLLPCAAALQEVNVASFGVGTVYEGQALREAGHEQEILILLGAQNVEEMHICAKHKLITHVYSLRGLEMAAAVASQEKPVHIAIKCETGMSRLGFSPEDIPKVKDFLLNHPHIIVEIAATHISCADMPHKEDMVREQAATFSAMIKPLQEAFPAMRLSLCNSAASLAYADLAANLGASVFRFGIALYGGNPFMHSDWQDKGAPLRETMRISATILHIYEAKAGQYISYGATYEVEKDMRIAVLGIGYADGFSRGMSCANDDAPTLVSINNCPAPLCGRVCMGTIMVDISAIDHVQEGQKAWIVDANIQQGQFSMQALADRWGTISYEAYCLLGKNTRRYAE